MKKLMPIVVSLLCILALLLFLGIQSLPQLNETVLNHTSLIRTINEADFSTMKKSSVKAIESAKGALHPRVMSSVVELKKSSALADSISRWFDLAQSQEMTIEELKNKLSISLVGSFDFKFIDTIDFSTPVKEVMARLDSFDSRADVDLKNMALENIRYRVLDILYYYQDELGNMNGAVAIKFDMGFPKRPLTWKAGLIAFNPPRMMELNEKHRMQVRISKDLRQNLLDKMASSESAVVDSLLVGDIMIVRMVGDDFDIMVHDEEEQGVLDEGFTQWEFDVTPRSSGTHTLYVKVGIVYSVPGLGPAKKFFPVYEKEIQIHVDTWKRVTSFATERWEFLVSTFLIPGMVWAYSRVRRGKGKDKRPAENP